MHTDQDLCVLSRNHILTQVHPIYQPDIHRLLLHYPEYSLLQKGQLPWIPVDQAGVPESFRVLIKEFQALGLDISVLTKDGLKDLRELESAEESDDAPVSIEEIDTNSKEDFTSDFDKEDEEDEEDFNLDDEESDDFELDDMELDDEEDMEGE